MRYLLLFIILLVGKPKPQPLESVIKLNMTRHDVDSILAARSIAFDSATRMYKAEYLGEACDFAPDYDSGDRVRLISARWMKISRKSRDTIVQKVTKWMRSQYGKSDSTQTLYFTPWKTLRTDYWIGKAAKRKGIQAVLGIMNYPEYPKPNMCQLMIERFDSNTTSRIGR